MICAGFAMQNLLIFLLFFGKPRKCLLNFWLLFSLFCKN